MRYFILILLLCFFNTSFGQFCKVRNLDSLAISYKDKGNYAGAIKIHQNVFENNPKNILNTYGYAQVYGLMQKKDSCFKYLNLALSPFLGVRHLATPDFYFLHNYPEWDSLEAKTLRGNSFQVKRIKDKEYAKKLLRLCAADQAYYSEIHLAEMKFGRDAKEVKDIWRKKNQLNLQNQNKLETLLSKKGWPKRSDVGNQAIQSAFLIIQHSNLDLMKQYLPIIKKYCNNSEGSCQSYALLFDRIRVNENKPQRYGTQISYNKKIKKYELEPLEDEGMVYEWRERAGLQDLETYVAHWGIKLDIERGEDNFAYADSLVSAVLSKESKHTTFHGAEFGKKAPLDALIKGMVPVEPKWILGRNKKYCLTMPKGSEIVVKFVDNQIVNYPDQDDIFIKEHGGASDKACVYVSHDGIQFDSLGITYDGRASSLDLESIQYPLSVKYIKIISLDNNGAYPGYDLEYIKGLPGSTVDAKLDEPKIASYLKSAKLELIKILGFKENPRIKKKKRVITKQKNKKSGFVLEEILFDVRSTRILKKSYPFLNQLAEELKKSKLTKVELTGHTDNRGSEKLNASLSLNRAISIRDYLIEKGNGHIDFICSGKGATQPRMSNDTKYGRSKNRRVELNLIK